MKDVFRHWWRSATLCVAILVVIVGIPAVADPPPGVPQFDSCQVRHQYIVDQYNLLNAKYVKTQAIVEAQNKLLMAYEALLRKRLK